MNRRSNAVVLYIFMFSILGCGQDPIYYPTLDEQREWIVGDWEQVAFNGVLLSTYTTNTISMTFTVGGDYIRIADNDTMTSPQITSGTWVIDDPGGTLEITVPTWPTEFRRIVELSSTDLKYTLPSGSPGGSYEVHLKRM